jgi:DNA-binding IclR family transcriptional regulator
LLLVLAHQPKRAVTVSELARELGVPRPTCDTLLLALAEHGFVQRGNDRRYSLGPASIVLGDAAQVANPLVRSAGDHAEALARSQGAVTAVMARDRDTARITAVFDFAPPLALRARVGDSFPLIPPFGASWLAWSNEVEVQAWLARAEPPIGNRDEADLRAALCAIRVRGYAVTIVASPAGMDAARRELARQTAGGTRSQQRAAAVRRIASSEIAIDDIAPGKPVRLARVSAPVLDGSGHAVAAIVLLGPPHEVAGRDVAAMGALVAEAANDAARLTDQDDQERRAARGGG